MATATITRVNNLSVELSDVVRFKTVNTHMPITSNSQVETITQNGEKVTGVVCWKGAVWFRDADGRNFVSFVNKTTALWQAVRTDHDSTETKVGQMFTISGIVKEFRPADQHGPDRHVVTNIKLS